jgi:hypothetical protein
MFEKVFEIDRNTLSSFTKKAAAPTTSKFGNVSAIRESIDFFLRSLQTPRKLQEDQSSQREPIFPQKTNDRRTVYTRKRHNRINDVPPTGTTLPCTHFARFSCPHLSVEIPRALVRPLSALRNSNRQISIANHPFFNATRCSSTSHTNRTHCHTTRTDRHKAAQHRHKPARNPHATSQPVTLLKRINDAAFNHAKPSAISTISPPRLKKPG